MDRLSNLRCAQHVHEPENELDYNLNSRTTPDPLLLFETEVKHYNEYLLMREEKKELLRKKLINLIQQSEPENESDLNYIIMRDIVFEVYDDYQQQRNKEELMHNYWIDLIQQSDLEEKFQDKMERNMKLRLGPNHVKFIYKYEGNEVLEVATFKFKIILLYCNLLRKWFISPGYSFVPVVIDLKSKLKHGTYNPLSEEIFKIIREVRHSIDTFMTRSTTVYQFVKNVQGKYKDMQPVVNPALTQIELIFMENMWPSRLPKLNTEDRIVIRLMLNRRIQVWNINYDCYIQIDRKTGKQKKYLEELEHKLQDFYNYPLEKAFEKFIGNKDYANEQESFK